MSIEWSVEWSIGLAVIIFGVLTFFLIQTLIKVQRTLESIQKQTESITHESLTLLSSTENRLKVFDPLLNSISNLGEICENKSLEYKKLHLAKHDLEELKDKDIPLTFIEWALLSVQLCKKISKKRR